MDLWLLQIGLAKLMAGALLAAVCVGIGTRVPRWLLGLGPLATTLRDGNVSAAIVDGASLLALALLVHPPIKTAFSAVDTLLYSGELAGAGIAWVLVYAVLHVTVALAVGTSAILAGTWLFVRSTPSVDELDQVRSGNVAPGFVLGAMIIAVAVLLGPGLDAVLVGLHPWPDVGLVPSPR